MTAAPVVLGERAPCPVPLVAVVPAVAAIDASPFAEALVASARGRGRRVALHADATDADLVVAVGEEAAARCIPRLTVIISGGLPPPSWSGVARALSVDADLIIAEARAGVGRALGAII